VLPSGECKSDQVNEDDESDDDVDWDTEAPIVGAAGFPAHGDNQNLDDSDNDNPTIVAPEFAEFSEAVRHSISKLGGSVLPKLNWSAPKDAKWINFNQSMLCTTFTDVLLLLKASEFVTHDLSQPFSNCDDAQLYSSGTGQVSSPIRYQLALRRWTDINTADEFRCFVGGGGKRVVAITQRHDSVFYPDLQQIIDRAEKDILTFFDRKIKGKFSSDSDFVFDAWIRAPGDVVLIDFNPWGTVTDALLFSWEELEEIRDLEKKVQSRYVDKASGVRADPYQCYHMPQDFLELSTGLDPTKFNDLMRLHEDGIQTFKKQNEPKRATNATGQKCVLVESTTEGENVSKESLHSIGIDESVFKVNIQEDDGKQAMDIDTAAIETSCKKKDVSKDIM